MLSRTTSNWLRRAPKRSAKSRRARATVEQLEDRVVPALVAFNPFEGGGNIEFLAFPQEANDVKVLPGLFTVVQDEVGSLLAIPPTFTKELVDHLTVSIGEIVQFEFGLESFFTLPDGVYCPSIGG